MSGRFEPKTPVQLDPPKDDPISLEDLAKADGKTLSPSSSACNVGSAASGRQSEQGIARLALQLWEIMKSSQ